MDPFLGIIVLVGIGFGLRTAADHARTARTGHVAEQLARAERDAAPGRLSAAQRARLTRRHTAGWWLSEVLHGFPVNRRGFHTGWLAHRAAAEQEAAIREEQRTQALETQASFRPSVAEHRQRQARIRQDLEQRTARPDAAGGRRGVREAADAVIYEFRRRRAQPEQPAEPEPGPYAAPAQDPLNPDLSDWLRPGEPPCRTCGGSGRNAAGTDACPECLGWGSGPADPAASVAASDGICGACGHGQRPGDPVLRQEWGEHVHQSHVLDDIERRNGIRALYRNDPEPGGTVPPAGTDGGNDMTATDTTYGETVATAARMQQIAEAAAHAARQTAAELRNLADQMAGAEVDGQTCGEAAELADAADRAEAAWNSVHDRAGALHSGVQQRHGNLAEAHQSAPVRAAQREYYEEG